MPGVSEYVRTHELLAVGTVAGVIVAGVALTQLRRPATPSSTGPGIPTIADLTAAGVAGAGAAMAAFQPGVDLANAGLSAGLGLGQAGLDTGTNLSQVSLAASTDALAAALGLAAQLAAGNAYGSGAAGTGGGVIPGGAGTGDGVLPTRIPTPTPTHSPTPSSGLVVGATLRFTGPTTIYARTTAGYIGSHKVFGSPGLVVVVNEILVPRDPARQTGGSFWRMTSGAAAGWLVSTSNPAIAVSGGQV